MILYFLLEKDDFLLESIFYFVWEDEDVIFGNNFFRVECGRDLKMLFVYRKGKKGVNK